MMLSNFYLLPLQSEIITNIQGCTSLAILNLALFLYLWLFHSNHRFIFIIVTNHGQKTFQVLIMGYIISMAYIQYKIDKFYKIFAPRPILTQMILSVKPSPYPTYSRSYTLFSTSSLNITSPSTLPYLFLSILISNS